MCGSIIACSFAQHRPSSRTARVKQRRTLPPSRETLCLRHYSRYTSIQDVAGLCDRVHPANVALKRLVSHGTHRPILHDSLALRDRDYLNVRNVQPVALPVLELSHLAVGGYACCAGGRKTPAAHGCVLVRDTHTS